MFTGRSRTFRSQKLFYMVVVRVARRDELGLPQVWLTSDL